MPTRPSYTHNLRNKPFLDVREYGMEAATQAAGTVSVSGATVTGTGTNFASVFKAGDTVTFYPTAQAGAGYITSGPLAGDIAGTEPRASLITGFGGASFTTPALEAGDLINTSIYGGIFAGSLPSGRSWPINTVISSTKLRTVFMMDPQVGGGHSYPTVFVSNNTAYVYGNTPHGLAALDPVAISGSGVTGLDGAYTVASVVAQPPSSSDSTCFTIATSGVVDGVYVTDGLTLSAGMPSPAFTVYVASSAAHVVFVRPHGFSTGDTVYFAGFTGAAAGLNGAHVVTGVGNTVVDESADYPKDIWFSTVGVADGTYSELTAMAGTTWTYTYHPVQATILSVTGNTSMTLTAPLSRAIPAGATCWNTPDN